MSVPISSLEILKVGIIQDGVSLGVYDLDLNEDDPFKIHPDIENPNKAYFMIHEAVTSKMSPGKTVIAEAIFRQQMPEGHPSPKSIIRKELGIVDRKPIV